MPRLKLNPVDLKYQKFNDYVKGELRRQGKSQEQLADYLFVTATCISYRLNGKVEWFFRDVLRTCEFLDIDVTEIF